MTRLASVAEGARVLEAAASSEQRRNVACGAPMQEVYRPAVAQPAGRTCPSALGAGQYFTLAICKSIATNFTFVGGSGLSLMPPAPLSTTNAIAQTRTIFNLQTRHGHTA